jgi:hypothetical protein
MVYIDPMAIDTFPVKKLIAFTTEQWQQVHRYRFDNEIQTESEAVRLLLDLGLKAAASLIPSFL